MNQTDVELPIYRSHKLVRAARITGFRANGIPGAPTLVLGEINAVVDLLPDWHAKHQPQVGGFYVVYEDGYKSFSPAKAFEDGYTAVSAPSNVTPSAAGGAPRVTLAAIEAAILTEHYFTAEQGAEHVKAHMSGTVGSPVFPESLSLLTFCVLTLRNGFTVTGESACVSPKNFDAELGRKIARQHAVEKVWPLLGYALRAERDALQVHLRAAEEAAGHSEFLSSPLYSTIAKIVAERDAAQAEVARLRDALERIVTADDDYGYHIARAALESKT